MRAQLIEWLACPACGGDLKVDPAIAPGEDRVDGELGCTSCGKSYPIRNGIPRFVSSDNYASSFGVQWQRYRTEQLDSFNGLSLSRDRFVSETTFAPDDLDGKVVLDAGSGAGRFLDVASDSNADVVGVDVTDAVDAARESLRGRSNVHLVQASIYELPFKSGAFDLCYCIGVIQHTPDPQASVAALPRLVKPGGTLAVTAYEQRRWTRLNAKYLARRLLKRVPSERLMSPLQVAVTVLFPITEVLFRLPVIGRFARFAIPIADYVDEPQLSTTQRYRWALMDTYDMIAPTYDTPQREDETRDTLAREGMVDIRRLPVGGLCLVSRKPAA